MKSLLAVVLLSTISLAAPPPGQVFPIQIKVGASDPATCSPTNSPGERSLFFNTTSNVWKYCSAANTWTALGGSLPSGCSSPGAGSLTCTATITANAFVSSDTTNNSYYKFVAGSGGDATVPACDASTGYLAFKAGVIEHCDPAGSYYGLLDTNSTLAVSKLGFSAPGTFLDLVLGNAVVIEMANAGVTGTTLNKLAKASGAPSTALIAATTDTSGILGIVVAGAGVAGNAQIAVSGEASCIFDGATTAGDYVQISSGTAGDCTDAGATYPVSGQVLGRVLSTNGGTGTYSMLLFGPGKQGSPDHVISWDVYATGDAKTYIPVYFACTIYAVDVTADQSGTFASDIDRHNAAIPNTTTDKISGTDGPALSGPAQINLAHAPSSWGSVALASGDVLNLNVTTFTTVTHVHVQLRCR